MDESDDGTEEALTRATRTLMSAAGLIGMALAELRLQGGPTETVLGFVPTRDELDIALDEQSARRALADVHRTEWWGNASPLDVARRYLLAKTWPDLGVEALHAEHRILRELRDRHGLSFPAPEVTRALSEERTLRAAAAEELTISDADKREAREHTRQAKASPGTSVESTNSFRRAYSAWDSSERRQELAQRLEGLGNHKVLKARMLAEVSQATPPSAAVCSAKPVVPATHRRGGQGAAHARQTMLRSR
ncbi:hypothetical protein [Arachnia propionica]|uniref:Uncharacterized protein n=1 Tax=Arachnia propionica TaxID=1750 RepID=A0A3P1WT78_9ACTN|nr:hypothetical protein [Arachnia propionica]RRD47673.1 hypothetical protein EII35_14605 [Arachnia propionica]